MKDSVLYKLKELNINILRKISQLKACSHSDISKVPNPTQMRIIEHLVKSDKPVLQRDLEDVLKVRRATVSSVLKTMEDKGFVTRKQDPYDSRSKLVALTEYTKERYEHGVKHLQDIEEIATRGIDPKDLEKFKQVLEQIKNNITNYEGEEE